ncbi:MAG: hypothetical protein AAF937_05600 [Planctomycetota bacterium]
MNVLIIDQSECERSIFRGILRSLPVGDIAEAGEPADALAVLRSFDADLTVLPAETAETEPGKQFIDSFCTARPSAGLIIIHRSDAPPSQPPSHAVMLPRPFSRITVAEAIHSASAKRGSANKAA